MLQGLMMVWLTIQLALDKSTVYFIVTSIVTEATYTLQL